ncbi:MAG TPA: translation initiation factor IF-2 N-terminal domain-containing protein, partial [Armatimonadota bacterium]
MYELAKELGVSNHDLMTVLAEMSVDVKSHASTLDAEVIDKVKAAFKKKNVPEKKVEKHEKRGEIVLPANVS